MAPHVDPLVGAAGDIGIGVESAECLDGVHLLYAEGFAMADQRRCILSVEHVFRQYGHVARTHGDRAAKYLIAFGCHELRKAGRTRAIPGGVPICGILYFRIGKLRSTL